MNKRFKSLVALAMLAAGSIAQASAQDAVTEEVVTETVIVEETPAVAEKPAKVADPFITEGALGHFTWGVDVGGGVDFTCHDMSSFQFSACFGYKGGWFRFAGVGIELAPMMNNSSRIVPFYAMLRTSFSPVHRFAFLELRGGVASCDIAEYKTQTNAYVSAGLGLTLAHSRKFSSHVIVRGSVCPLKKVEAPDGSNALDYVLAYGSIGIGCAF